MKNFALVVLLATVFSSCSGGGSSAVEVRGASVGLSPSPTEPSAEDSFRLEIALDQLGGAKARLEKEHCDLSRCDASTSAKVERQIKLLEDVINASLAVERLAAGGFRAEHRATLEPRVNEVRASLPRYQAKAAEKKAQLAQSKELWAATIAEKKQAIEALNQQALADGCVASPGDWVNCGLRNGITAVEDLIIIEKQLKWAVRYYDAYDGLRASLQGSGLSETDSQVQKAEQISLSARSFKLLFEPGFAKLANDAINHERKKIARLTGVPGLQFEEIKRETLELSIGEHVARAERLVKESKVTGARMQRLGEEISLRAIYRVVVVASGSHQKYLEEAFQYHPDHASSLEVKISETESEVSALAFLRTLDLKSGRKWQERAAQAKRWDAALAIPLVREEKGTFIPVVIQVSEEFLRALPRREKLAKAVQFIEGLLNARAVINESMNEPFIRQMFGTLQGNERITICDIRSCQFISKLPGQYVIEVGGSRGFPSNETLKGRVLEYAWEREKPHTL